MRLNNIWLSGFRSFARQVEIDLSADVVVLSGPNGTGKTSLVDAIHWVLLGRIARFNAEQAAVISAYSPDGTARVRLSLGDCDGDSLVVERAFDGERMTLSVTKDGHQWTKEDAEERLRTLLWSRFQLDSYDPVELEAQFTKTIYLQQDVVTEFVEDDDQSRFKSISTLVGSRHVADLQVTLESARNAWRRAQTKRADEVKEAEAEYRRLSDRLQKLPDADPRSPQVYSEWTEFLGLLAREGIAHGSEVGDDITSSSARLAAENIVKELRSLRREIDQRITDLDELVLIVGEETEPIDDRGVQERLNKAQQNLTELRRQHETERKRVDEQREQLRQLRDSSEQLATMARLAMNHLGDRCPVCTQEIDKDATRSHLETLVALIESPPEHPDSSTLDRLSRDVSEMERTVKDALNELEEEKQTQAKNRMRVERAFSDAQKLGLEIQADAGIPSLRQLIKSENDRLLSRRKEISHLLDRGESLLVAITRMGEFAQREETMKALDQSEIRLGKLLETQNRYETTYGVATQIIEGLRQAATDATRLQIEEIEPGLSKIYWRINPHPVFTSIRFDTFMANRKGHTRVLVSDSEHDEMRDREPKHIFSSSQMNALAVSIFLTFNLQRRELPLDLAVLDDPLQSLDDVNLLGLVDVLRRMKRKRQLVLTTHDQRFQKVLSRKLRPTRESESIIVVAFSDWGRDGPTFELHRSAGRPSTQSVVSAA